MVVCHKAKFRRWDKTEPGAPLGTGCAGLGGGVAARPALALGGEEAVTTILAGTQHAVLHAT